MKVKVKNDICKINLKVNFREMTIIKEALLEYEINNAKVQDLNSKVFDCQETDINTYKLDKIGMVNKIHKTQEQTIVW